MIKPFLRWAGSKKKLLPELEKFYPENTGRYIEPFAGSGQLFFRLPVKDAILSDTNVDLMMSYKNIRDFPNEVFNELQKFETGKDAYYSLRREYNQGTVGVKNTALFLYLNAYCFNGLYRTNNSGEFNVPYSASSGVTANEEYIKEISKYLQRANFVVGDFEKVVKEYCEPNDFVYLDPPYAIKNRRIFNQYGPHTFGLNDLARLKDLLYEIDKRDAHFVLSYAECEEAESLKDGWEFHTVRTIRNISGFSQHRKVENEVIITNIKVS